MVLAVYFVCCWFWHTFFSLLEEPPTRQFMVSWRGGASPRRFGNTIFAVGYIVTVVVGVFLEGLFHFFEYSSVVTFISKKLFSSSFMSLKI